MTKTTFFCILFFFGTMVPVIGYEIPETVVDQIAEKFIGPEKPIVGGVVGIVSAEKTFTKGYGQLRNEITEKSNTPDAETVYEIASISKTFTAILLAEMVLRGEISLDDPIEKFLPGEITVPSKDGQKIRLIDLATHSSGFPRLPDDFWKIARQDIENPYCYYSNEDILAAIENLKLTRGPGEQYEYSNFAFAVLGRILELKTGQSFPTLVQQRICEPLGMKNTAVEFSENMKCHLAPGYDAEKKPAKNWDLQAFAGGGGLRSDMHDMMRFAQMAAGIPELFPELPEDAMLVQAFRESQKIQYQNKEQHKTMGLAWHINPDRGTLFHDGQTGGYHSYIVAVPEKQIAVVVLTNTAIGDVNVLGDEILHAVLSKL